ncbi:CubicO group peptidase, beta-lactamase class C family [Kaistia soli DSM 19436]|uniref:CubicO group peptidase, beta-lactamase class C family n=1 Tax=Kaistia soli DSM 19436 TaxID=1122133 RepID=A0A1M5I7I4_9HYPH|nr:serine hydrolase [Kaistia soli]SHG24192.1 CubicO group peptidase, beta-lactamase class C family [Kaistia soli DSM 19436]
MISLRILFAPLLLLALASGACAKPWQSVDPAASGWSVDRLKAAEAFAADLNPTAVMVVQDGKVVARWGDVTRRVNIASVRKSLLSALYGIAIAEGRIDPASTLGELGIDDKAPALTAAEKQATVRDLLMTRSGVYHAAAYETADARGKRPGRGSHAPGTFWYYNNWDFNALGTIYRRQTGEDIFASFARRIAAPIGMEDFSVRDGRYVLEGASVHPAYPFMMSARDLARFGQLFLNGGTWDGREVVPAAWARLSTSALSQPPGHNSGYGYMWWTLNTDQWGEGGAFNAGYGGEVIAFLPEMRLVIVQTVDPSQNSRGIEMRDFFKLMRKIVDAAPSGSEPSRR